jgi:hypothetical protein
LSATDADVETRIARAFAEWRTLLVDRIEQAQRDGAIDRGQNAQALATLLLSVMRGLEALHKGGAKPAQLKAATEAMIALIG